MKRPAGRGISAGNICEERDPELERIRTEKFEKAREGIIRLWRRADINWDSVVINFRFGNKKEAQEWFRNKIEA